jgi:integrase
MSNIGVADIELAHVVSVLEPIWHDKTATASVVRSRIEAVLGWATTHGYRSGENTARWRGHMENLLPRPSKVRRPEQFAALPYSQIGEFMAELRQRHGLAERALEFAILTATRTGEVLGAKWSEIDLSGKVWVVPAERMKARREHRVPLGGAVVELLQDLPRDGDYVFETADGRRLHDRSLLMGLARMGRRDYTVHGFRSTFSTWAAERTNYSFEVREMALAHVVGNQVERAYQRSDLFERRRRLMEDWAEFCVTPATSGAVVALQSA